jgi:hypothetical protein
MKLRRSSSLLISAALVAFSVSVVATNNKTDEAQLLSLRSILKRDKGVFASKEAPMQNRYFQIASHSSVVCIIAIANIVIYSQHTKLQDDDITRAIQKFQSLSFRRRADGFYYLVETGLGDKLGGRTYQIPGALSRLFSKFPTRADELKLALIQLLELENSPSRKYHREVKLGGYDSGEEFISYHGDLIAAVAGLKDKRSLNALLGAMETGHMAMNGLAALGDDAVDAVMERFNRADQRLRTTAAMVLSKMLNSGTIKNTAYVMKIKEVFMVAISDKDWSIRLSAIRGLARFNDPDVIALIEKVAKSDPREISWGGGRPSAFPVREEAQRVLQSMKAGSQKQ